MVTTVILTTLAANELKRAADGLAGLHSAANAANAANAVLGLDHK